MQCCVVKKLVLNVRIKAFWYTNDITGLIWVINKKSANTCVTGGFLTYDIKYYIKSAVEFIVYTDNR